MTDSDSLLPLEALDNGETSACMCWILLIGSSSSKETTEVMSTPWEAGKLELEQLSQSPDKQVLTRTQRKRFALEALCTAPEAVILFTSFSAAIHL